jgi:hypothetical protein
MTEIAVLGSVGTWNSAVVAYYLQQLTTTINNAGLDRQ